ncbi:MAG: hypothetical protein LUC96_13085, partial [Alistipes sp.]|uniref:hypothetical protein n=1 Tax=Alistipes sp. TaxID=1872444 RepID=UPI0025BAF0C5
MFDILRVGVCHGLCRGCGSGRSGLPPDTERSLRDGVYVCFGERYVLMSGTFAGACVVRHSER